MKDNICKGLSFEECELAILRMQVDKAEKKIGKRLVSSKDVQNILKIVENFIRDKKLICYGGLAIDRLLPENDKIYNKDIDLPDYDFFSSDALNDAKRLGDLYAKKGYEEIEVKSGQHFGTYKVFVNFFSIADITSIPKELFMAIKSKAMRIDGIYYTDPNFLRMGMYLELSRPDGDVSRFEKVLKRLILINKHYPFDKKECIERNFQREMYNKEDEYKIYTTLLDAFVNKDVVFFGGYAISLYSRYMPHILQKKLKMRNYPDFDVLAIHPEKIAEYVKEKLKSSGIEDVRIIKHEPLGEIIPIHYEIAVGKDTVAFIYKTIACHSYNIININKRALKIATIDTMLTFYLAFLYANRDYYDRERILCMAKFLFDVQQHNRLKQKGLLKRFSISCYGHQKTVEEMREKKAKKFHTLRKNKKSLEYQKWFLNYRPYDIKHPNKTISPDTSEMEEKSTFIKSDKKTNISKKKSSSNNNSDEDSDKYSDKDSDKDSSMSLKDTQKKSIKSLNYKNKFERNKKTESSSDSSKKKTAKKKNQQKKFFWF